MTVHFVYPYDEKKTAAPWSIGNYVAAGLRAAGYHVQQYDWESTETVVPDKGDILLGHPHPNEGFVFRNSLAGWWSRRVALCPFNGSPENVEFTRSWLPAVDKHLAICGPHWAQFLDSKSAPVDMAIDRRHYRRVIKFKEPGQRAIAYVGCLVKDKGPEYLQQLAELVNADVYHFGLGETSGKVKHCGYQVFDGWAPDMDFIIATGVHDANPTSIIEGASWGMVAFCTPQSGWGQDVAIHIDQTSVDAAAATINEWLALPTETLEKRRAEVDLALSKYSWSNFVNAVLESLGGL